MRILGIDPGYAIVGYGVIEYEGNRFKTIDYGKITTTPKYTLAERLQKIYEGVCGVISIHKPEMVAVEELFFNNNVTTAIAVAQARGVVLLASSQSGKPLYEYTPLQVKQAVVGYGRAQKEQVQQMVKVILNLEKIPKPDDVADALAVAVCHAHSHHVNNRLNIR